MCVGGKVVIGTIIFRFIQCFEESWGVSLNSQTQIRMDEDFWVKHVIEKNER